MIETILRNKLIIAADDFGKNEFCNTKILELVKGEKIDRVAIMTNGNFGPKDIERLKNSAVKLDIHLNFGDWKINDRRNNFLKSVIFFLKYISRTGHGKKAEEKLERQILKFKEIFGRFPDGVNSHEYVHFFPPYFRIALKLSEKYNINYIRFGKRGFLGRNNFVRFILQLLRKMNREAFFCSGCNSSDFLASLDWIGDLDEFIEKLPEGVTELVCHPEREKECKQILSITH